MSRTTLTSKTPIWNVNADALAKINEIPTVKPPDNMNKFSTETLVYMRKVERHASKGSPVRRVLVLSRQSLFLCTEQGEVKRMIPVTAITELRIGKSAGRPQLLLIVPCDHDILVTFYDDKSMATNSTMEDFIRYLQLMNKGWTSQLIPERTVDIDNKLVDGANLKKPEIYENPKARLAALEKLCRDHTPPMQSLPKTQLQSMVSESFSSRPPPPPPPWGLPPSVASPSPTPAPYLEPQQHPPLPVSGNSFASSRGMSQFAGAVDMTPMSGMSPSHQHMATPRSLPNPRSFQQPPPEVAPSPSVHRAQHSQDIQAEVEFYKSKAFQLEQMKHPGTSQFQPQHSDRALVPVPDFSEDEISNLRVQLDCERQALQRVRNSARSERILAQLVTAICYQNTKKLVSKFEQNYDELLKSKESSLDMAYTRVTELENTLYREGTAVAGGRRAGPANQNHPLPPPMMLGRTTVPQEMTPQMHDVFKQYLSPNKVALLNQL